VLASALVGCATTPQPKIEYGYCAPPAPEGERIVEDPAPPAGASRTAYLAALLGLSSALAEREAGPLSVDTRLRVLERLEVARIEISATTAELDCEGERLIQAADYLSRSQSSAVQTLTVASVLTAAGTAVAAVFLATANASGTTQDLATVAGSGVTAGLGIGALFVNPTLSVEHSRNLLTDVWRGPSRATMYPEAVWAYLNRREFSNAQDVSIREKIIERWRRTGQIEDDPRAMDRFLDAGGPYDAEALRRQQAMLAQVKAEVSLANQDLEVLAARLLKP
jgi:hypothetical protein